VRRTIRSGERVEGRSSHDAVTVDEVPCRLIQGDAREVDDHGRRRVVASAQIVARTTDLRASDTVEIDGSTWRVVSLPEVLHGRSTTPLTTATLQRTVEGEVVTA